MTYLFSETEQAASPIHPFVQTNAAGQTIGYGLIGGTYHAYYTDAAGIQIIVEPPGSAYGPLVSIDGSQASGNYTMVYAINGHGVVVGHFTDAAGKIHGYVADHGVYTVVDVPGSSATWVQGIDDSNDIYGSYTPSGGGELKFLGSTSSPF